LVAARLATSLLCCAAASAVAPAQLRFGADPAATVWQFKGDRTACRLTHEIPNFGRAQFGQEAGGRLAFEMTSWRVELLGEFAVYTETPDWSPVRGDGEPLGEAKTVPPHEIVGAAPLAESMLRTLYLGRFPTVASDDLAVSLSAVGFRDPYDAYSRCVGELLPASFAQLKRSSIAFESGRAELDDTARARLDQISQYLRADRTVTRIHVDGYTDSSGREPKNRALSEARARAVSDYLVASGFDAESIETRFHSSRFPAAPNKTDEGRAQNRRVVVRLEQSGAKMAQR
jgi:outer membrane protein OmpA-like peptidoglycan-associated protein